VCENPSGEDWVGSEQQQGEGDEEGDSPGEEAKIRKLHRMKVLNNELFNLKGY
jgi:hypothetical protein